MFSINENHQLYLYNSYVVLRKGFNALYGVINNSLGAGTNEPDYYLS
jgi:hypothetical protein